MRGLARRSPLVLLVAVLALLYGWIGITASGWDRLWGLAGALCVLAALGTAPRSRVTAGALLAAGALPLAIATWWSLVTPVLALLLLVLGGPAVGSLHVASARPVPTTTP